MGAMIEPLSGFDVFVQAPLRLHAANLLAGWSDVADSGWEVKFAGFESALNLNPVGIPASSL
jgi:hypothetical protein